MRAAQISYDLRFDGATIVYSWPSQNSFFTSGFLPFGYTADEGNAEWSIPHFESFLDEIVNRSGAGEIHLIAHSMGNRILLEALKNLKLKYALKKKPVFNEVVLAAPDIDADVFKREIVPELLALNERTTMYASNDDFALNTSKKVHGNIPRAGEAGKDLIVIPGIDTIDASGIDLSNLTDLDEKFIGHHYFFENLMVIQDVYAIINYRARTTDRKLDKKWKNNRLYWYLAP